MLFAINAGFQKWREKCDYKNNTSEPPRLQWNQVRNNHHVVQCFNSGCHLYRNDITNWLTRTQLARCIFQHEADISAKDLTRVRLTNRDFWGIIIHNDVQLCKLNLPESFALQRNIYVTPFHVYTHRFNRFRTMANSKTAWASCQICKIAGCACATVG